MCIFVVDMPENSAYIMHLSSTNLAVTSTQPKEITMTSFFKRHFGRNLNPKPFKLPVYQACILTMLGITSQALSENYKWRNGVMIEAQEVKLYQQCADGDWGCELGNAHQKGGAK